MHKTKLSIAIASIILVVSSRSALAISGPSVSIVQLPILVNWTNFTISYSAIAPEGLNNVTLQFHKEGNPWQTLQSYTTNSGDFGITNTQITGDTKYFFSATVCDNASNCTTDYTETTVDRVAPPKPTNFSNDKTTDTNHRIRWTNENSDDLYQVYVYRGDHLGFNADSGSQVATINVTKNTNSEFNNAVPLDGKNYYYLLRSIDKAGNASDVVGDMEITYTTSTSSTNGPTGTPASGNEAFGGQKLALFPSVLGTTSEPTSEPTVTPTPSTKPTPESAVASQVNAITKSIQKTSPLWPILGFTAFAAVIYWFVSNNKSAVKETKSTVKRGKKK